MIFKYLSCCKAFDSSQINADVATSLCSICNKLFRSNIFPAYGMGNAKSNDADEIDTVDLKWDRKTPCSSKRLWAGRKSKYWRFVKDPNEREELILYGCDRCDAIQSNDVEYVYNCMIIDHDRFKPFRISTRLAELCVPTHAVMAPSTTSVKKKACYLRFI